MRVETQTLAKKYVRWIETGELDHDLFAPDAFLDLTVPHWRVQAEGADGVVGVRKERHGMPGIVPRYRVDETETGFVIEWEEEWDHGGDHWYCREMARADVVDGAIAGLSVYCTGDWPSSLVEMHQRDVTLLRP